MVTAFFVELAAVEEKGCEDSPGLTSLQEGIITPHLFQQYLVFRCRR